MSTPEQQMGQPTGGLADAMLQEEPAAQAAPEAPAPEPQFVENGYQDQYASAQPADEEEELLFGETLRPNDVPGMRPSPYRKQVPAPRNMERDFALLSEVAKEPDAPAELHAFLRQLSFHLNKER